MTPHTHDSSNGPKGHAQRRDVPPGRRPLWVYDNEDWELMCSLPSGTLICPEPGCRSAFKKPLSNARGTRWLANLPGTSCGHLPPRPGLGGGSMTAQHRWLEARLARLCEALGFEAITEHYATNSDVYVPAARYSLEVQRGPTDFPTRTGKRLESGQMVWFVTEDARGNAAKRALFEYPAVRLAVVSRWDKNIPLTPWDDPSTVPDSRLYVFATVARLYDGNAGLVTGRMDAMAFLREILTGERRWYPPYTPGAPRLTSGFWARTDDLKAARLAAFQAGQVPLSIQVARASPALVSDGVLNEPTNAGPAVESSNPAHGISEPKPTDWFEPRAEALSQDLANQEGAPQVRDVYADGLLSPNVEERPQRRAWWSRLLGWLGS